MYDASQVDLDELLKGLSPLGYRASIQTSAADLREERVQDRIGVQMLAAFGFGMQVMMLYLVQLYPLYALGQYDSQQVKQLQYIVWFLTTIILFFGGSTFLVGAWRALKARTASMDTLVTLGAMSAYVYSVYVTLSGNGETYFDSVAMITSFILFGRYLETVGGSKARKDLSALLRLQPDQAWLKSAQGWNQVKAPTLVVGDVILVKPGERAPVDGQVLEGAAAANEALLTGESLPVAKSPGDRLYAGSLVSEGALVCQVLQPSNHTRLAQISQIVTETLSAKPPIQRMADRASAYFAAGILVTAVLTFCGYLVFRQPLATAVLRAVAVLVVACPCALGLATPLAISVTLGRALRQGILIRNASAFETAPAIRYIVLDKTGTLTRGQPSVIAATPAANTGLDQAALLRLAAAVEQYSEHPLARAIVQSSTGPLPEASGFLALRGLGASAVVPEWQGQRVTVGSARLVERLDTGQNGGDALDHEADQRAGRGETVVWVAGDRQVIGLIALRDSPNPTAYPALKRLRQLGIPVEVLSGDTEQTTRIIAEELNITAYKGGCMPEEKAAQIKQLQTQGIHVGMVGDGVNDAPALAQADLSITVAGGSDIAGQASDLILTHADLMLVPWFIQLSQQTHRTISINLGWAFAYNLVVLPLAVAGWINPVVAAITMATSSLLVVLNSLTIRGKQFPKPGG